MSNCKVIALTNQKGGVGKTTTAVNLGVGLAKQGKRVLLIDADAQANLTMALGYNRPDDLPITLSTIMQNIIDDKSFDVSQGILSRSEGVELLPSNIELSGFEVRLINAMSRERVLKTYVNEVKKNYDYVLIDCMPSLGMITINALAAADSVVIPTQPHYLSAKGLELLLRSVSMVKRQINPKRRIDGILSDQHTGDERAAFSQRRHFGALVAVFSVHLLVYPLLRHVFIQNIQINVRQQRREDAALRGSVLVYITLVHDARFEHGFNNHDHPLILYAHMIQAFQKDTMIYPVKAFGNIIFYNPVPAVLMYRSCDSFQRHFGVAHWPESVGMLIELSFHNGLQYNSHTFLHDSVPYRGDTQRPFFSLSGLVYVFSPNHFRYIVPECALDIVDHPVFSALQISPDADTVHAGCVCALIGLDIMDCGDDCCLCRHDFYQAAK